MPTQKQAQLLGIPFTPPPSSGGSDMVRGAPQQIAGRTSGISENGDSFTPLTGGGQPLPGYETLDPAGSGIPLAFLKNRNAFSAFRRRSRYGNSLNRSRSSALGGEEQPYQDYGSARYSGY